MEKMEMKWNKLYDFRFFSLYFTETMWNETAGLGSFPLDHRVNDKIQISPFLNQIDVHLRFLIVSRQSSIVNQISIEVVLFVFCFISFVQFQISSQIHR